MRLIQRVQQYGQCTLVILWQMASQTLGNFLAPRHQLKGVVPGQHITYKCRGFESRVHRCDHGGNGTRHIRTVLVFQGFCHSLINRYVFEICLRARHTLSTL